MTESWKELVDEAVALRRDLHRRPELAWEEEQTAARVRAELDRAGIPWRACAETGTVATLAADAAGRHVALRADIDALPIEEASGVAWTSEVPGLMHACGHDGHTATLFAATWWLKRHEDRLPGPVSLLFQPAEEGGHGADRMVRDGALEGVDAVFGWHNWPAIPRGRAICPDGAVMAANATFRITLRGIGGHASQPEACRDPVLAASAVTLALQQVVARRLPPQEAAVVSVTSIEAGNNDTIIPDRAVLGGSIRCGDTAARDRIFEMMEAIATETARGYGVETGFEPRPRYDATVNHPGEAERMRAALAAELGEDWRAAEPLPIMASEDFSYYLAERPGAFALVGSGDPEAANHPCHSPHYDFADHLIPVVARVYARLAGIPEGALPPTP